MKITKDQISNYKKDGFILIEDYFSIDEIEMLKAEFPKTIEENSPRVILEDNGSVRSVFAPHFNSEIFDKLGKLDRIVTPTEQLLESQVYLHQYKINSKKGLLGDWWEWHQDFPYWHYDDGIQRPELISVMVFLDNTDEKNGALLLVPKSQNLGIAKFQDKGNLQASVDSQNQNDPEVSEYLTSLTSNIKFTVDKKVVKDCAKRYGIVAASGKAGTVLFFHGNILHASNVNLSPFDRDVVIITYNSINNLPKKIDNRRPEYLAGRNYEAIKKYKGALTDHFESLMV